MLILGQKDRQQQILENLDMSLVLTLKCPHVLEPGIDLIHIPLGPHRKNRAFPLIMRAETNPSRRRQRGGSSFVTLFPKAW